MRVLITGSSGQIGTNLGLALLGRGDEIVGLDVRPNAWTDAIPTVIADLNQHTDGRLPVDGAFDCIVHLAAHAKVFELVETPQRALENIQMLFAAVEFARRHGNVPLIFGSSREVYGDIHHHVTHEALADFVVAESPYSASKIAGEAMTYSFAECYDLPCVVFRFSNVYGKYDCDLERMERVIPLFIRKVDRGEPITVFGPEKVLDFTYVDDCVRGVMAGIDRLVAGTLRRETINIAYGQGQTLIDLVNLIGLSLGKEPNVTCEPTRAGEVTRYVADIAKARELLGYAPQVPLTRGIALEVRWQREHGYLGRG
jgi:nucleoside-diphosphate-sugar epimerase